MQVMKIESMNENPYMMRDSVVVSPSTSAMVELSQFHSQLSTLIEKIEEMNYDKIGREQFWCIMCKMEGHTVNYFLSQKFIFMASNLTPPLTRFPIDEVDEYCKLCKRY